MPALMENGLLTDAMRAHFLRDGFLVIPGLFGPEEVEELRDTFMAQAQNGPVPGLSDMHAKLDPDEPLARYPRMMHPHRHTDKPVGPLALRAMLDARVRAILEGLMGEEPAAAQSMFYFKPPGARGQDLHQDNFYLRVKPGTCYAAWLAIDDADEENGGMVVVPGSGDLEIVCPDTNGEDRRFFTTVRVAPPSGLSEEPVPLRAGDVLFFNGSLIHGSYPNTSRDRFRRAFICHYVPRSSAELSGGYKPVSFEGTPITTIAPAVGGGACGDPRVTGPH